MTYMKHLKRYDCIDVGDWVRFMKGGELVIGEVQYIIDNGPLPGPDFFTTVGMTRSGDILETRRESVEDSGK